MTRIRRRLKGISSGFVVVLSKEIFFYVATQTKKAQSHCFIKFNFFFSFYKNSIKIYISNHVRRSRCTLCTQEYFLDWRSRYVRPRIHKYFDSVVVVVVVFLVFFPFVMIGNDRRRNVIRRRMKNKNVLPFTFFCRSRIFFFFIDV